MEGGFHRIYALKWRELPLAALLAWDWQVGTEGAQGAGDGQGWQRGTDWMVFAPWPQRGFASLETLELRGTLQVVLRMAAATSVCVSCGAFCACTEAEYQILSMYKFPEGDKPSLCCFVLCGFSLSLLMVLIPQLCVIYL